MKHISICIISLWVGILAVSCGKSGPEAPETSEGIPMSFGPAAVSRSANLLDTDDINTSGNQLTVYDLYTVDGQSVLYMDATQVTCDRNGNWTYSPLKYWTETGEHAFTAYLSHQGGITLDGTNTNYPTVTYSQPDNALRISQWKITHANQFDFLYAWHSRNMETVANPHAPVEFSLNHLLCAVQFNVVNLFDVNGTITVSDFKLSGLSNTQQAALSLSDGSVSYQLDATTGTGEGEIARTGSASVKYNEAYNVFAGYGTVGSEGYLLMWPHDETSFKNLQVSFSQGNMSRTLFLSAAETNHWRAGQKYTYNLYVKDDRINIQVEVRPWIIHDIDLE